MDNTRSSIPIILLITLGVIGAAVGYYFWEAYLLTHYLGGYDQYGLPVQRSYPGFHFFFHAWPLWFFPMIVILAIMIFLQWLRMAKVRREKQILTKILADKTLIIEELHEELHALKTKLDKVRDNSLLEEKYEQLEDELFSLEEDYERSLNFIEKLLEKVPYTQDSQSK
ncbi:hypothetical protein [Legionella oakridgensis]|uniref:Uncharacterized protein n=2 Tax=Legionella oakridgensis TaxID=29423 RepID=W0B8D7_9GAMM|nr:hypothetical protein [Legionella oakridgensis]AHE66135.1 hypothetical protein Loa_00565 [Legionella oakridgensis ATCC 33761 = DSM 21215]ETO94002.1 hypothetical protein LOR_52c10020 [Legionella oakridgensis RV-2-2007]KTD43880.1 hypothetical protein Loak_0430 [Legionella oakridgensis]STY16048.1 Uncharacterised protein [Legionella longbeachae]